MGEGSANEAALLAVLEDGASHGLDEILDATRMAYDDYAVARSALLERGAIDIDGQLRLRKLG